MDFYSSKRLKYRALKLILMTKAQENYVKRKLDNPKLNLSKSLEFLTELFELCEFYEHLEDYNLIAEKTIIRQTTMIKQLQKENKELNDKLKNIKSIS
jgi:hypothetical protein